MFSNFKKKIKDPPLHFRKMKFEEEEKVVRENMEREARQEATTTFVEASQSKDKGKAIIETHGSAHSSQEMEAHQRGEEFKQGLAKVSG